MLSSSTPDQYPDPATLMISVDIIDGLFSSAPVQDSGSGFGMTPVDSRKLSAVNFSLDCRNFFTVLSGLDVEDVDIYKQQTAAVTDKYQQHHKRM